MLLLIYTELQQRYRLALRSGDSGQGGQKAPFMNVNTDYDPTCSINDKIKAGHDAMDGWTDSAQWKRKKSRQSGNY